MLIELLSLQNAWKFQFRDDSTRKIHEKLVIIIIITHCCVVTITLHNNICVSLYIMRVAVVIVGAYNREHLIRIGTTAADEKRALLVCDMSSAIFFFLFFFPADVYKSRSEWLPGNDRFAHHKHISLYYIICVCVYFFSYISFYLHTMLNIIMSESRNIIINRQ